MSKKLTLSAVMGVLLTVAAAGGVSAESTVQLGAERVGITFHGGDDHLRCRLNGELVAKADFGDPVKDVELTAKLKPGANKLTCSELDDQGGSCYSYKYEVWTRSAVINRQVVHSVDEGCCDSSCARPGNTVFTETIWINKT